MTVTQNSTAIRISAPGVYGEILDFLVDEADLLDRGLDLEWLERLAEDISYRMPIREARYRNEGDGIVEHGWHYDENWTSLRLRVKRNTEVQGAYDRDPPPRIRRLIANLVVHQGAGPDEYLATSSILVLRNRFDQLDFDIMSAVRDDIIRRAPDGLKLASRTVLIDQAVLGRPWANVFM